MGKCKYCGLSAGWFRDEHKECKQINVKSLADISALSCQAIIEHMDENETRSLILELQLQGHVSKQALETAVGEGIKSAVEHFLDDNVLSEQEESSIDRYLKVLPISAEALSAFGLSQKLVKASIIRSIGQGQVPDPKFTIDGHLPFLFQKSEKLIWVFQDVDYLEQRTRMEYQGGSQGVSIRITKGVYYRTGAFKGRRVEVEELKNIGTGIVALTSKHIYFGASQTSFKVPYSKIVALNTYSDGIQIQKDGVRSKPQIFKGLDGWFASNIITNLNG